MLAVRNIVLRCVVLTLLWLQSKGVAPDADAYSSVLRVCSRSALHLQALCNFSGARSLLQHVVGIHAGMVETRAHVGSGAALIAASAHQVMIAALSVSGPNLYKTFGQNFVRNLAIGNQPWRFLKKFQMLPMQIWHRLRQSPGPATSTAKTSHV
jgi:hypothetical protein